MCLPSRCLAMVMCHIIIILGLFFKSGFEVIILVIMKGSIFWDITPCSPLNVNRRFGRTHLHFVGRRISQLRNHHEAGSQLSLTNYMTFPLRRKNSFSSAPTFILHIGTFQPIYLNKFTYCHVSAYNKYDPSHISSIYFHRAGFIP
jgi:hypothetical protein